MRPEDQRRSGPAYTTVCRTLVFLTRGDQVLLLKGAPHKRLWAGKYNGIGGHLEPGESSLAAALRELREEAGIASADLALKGIVHITMPEPPGIVLFVYTGTAESIHLIPSEEGTPVWVHRDDLRALPLVEDLPVLLPRVLAPGPMIHAAYHVTEDGLDIDFD